VFAAGKTNAAEFMVNETTLKEAAGREEERVRERKGGRHEEHGQNMVAWVQIILLARQHRFTHK
jgi:hypothetical protein